MYQSAANPHVFSGFRKHLCHKNGEKTARKKQSKIDGWKYTFGGFELHFAEVNITLLNLVNFTDKNKAEQIYGCTSSDSANISLEGTNHSSVAVQKYSALVIEASGLWYADRLSISLFITVVVEVCPAIW